VRPANLTDSSNQFVSEFANWLASRIDSVRRDENEAERLLSLGEYRAAVVAAVSSLERALADFEPSFEQSSSKRPPMGLSSRVLNAAELGRVDPAVVGRTREALILRNEVLHLGRVVTGREARIAVEAVAEYLSQLRQI
jgi:hypothetical protein